MIDLAFGNMRDYKNTMEMEKVIGWVPTAWCLLVKHFIPQVLLILFINLATSENDDGKSLFGRYGDHPMMPYQAIGIFVVCLSIAVFFVGLLFPDVYSGLVSYDDEEPEGAIKGEEAQTCGSLKSNTFETSVHE